VNESKLGIGGKVARDEQGIAERSRYKLEMSILRDIPLPQNIQGWTAKPPPPR
jgi:hypothetical protein